MLRLMHSGRSQRQIASSLSVAVGTVCGQLKRAQEVGMTWERAEKLTDAELEALMFRDGGRNVAATRAAIDYARLHGELHRPGVTLQLLWSEYLDGVAARQDGTKPYQYSQFCELYGAWRARLQPSMRIVHRAGEKAFIDYSGKKPRIWDRETGEAREVELFVMVLGASSYTYAEATRTQTLPDFVGSTIHGFEYFGGVPEMIVPDQLRSAVKGPDRYEPDINATYLEMAQHYSVTVMPARPRKPKDKAKVEVGVQVVQRWILARLRTRRFFSIDELNQAIWELLDELNARCLAHTTRSSDCCRPITASSFRPRRLPGSPPEASSSPWVRAQRFARTRHQYTLPTDRFRASPLGAGSPTVRVPYGASLALGSVLHLRLPSDLPRGIAPAFDVGFLSV
jgi:transposase